MAAAARLFFTIEGVRRKPTTFLGRPLLWLDERVAVGGEGLHGLDGAGEQLVQLPTEHIGARGDVYKRQGQISVPSSILSMGPLRMSSSSSIGLGIQMILSRFQTRLYSSSISSLVYSGLRLTTSVSSTAIMTPLPLNSRLPPSDTMSEFTMSKTSRSMAMFAPARRASCWAGSILSLLE